jgi:hypothetical protein
VNEEEQAEKIGDISQMECKIMPMVENPRDYRGLARHLFFTGKTPGLAKTCPLYGGKSKHNASATAAKISIRESSVSQNLRLGGNRNPRSSGNLVAII